jgi:hypothetical protein
MWNCHLLRFFNFYIQYIENTTECTFVQGCGSGTAWIRIQLSFWIRIHLFVFQILKSHIQNFEPIFISLFYFIFSSNLMRITFTCAWLQIIWKSKPPLHIFCRIESFLGMEPGSGYRSIWKCRIRMFEKCLLPWRIKETKNVNQTVTTYLLVRLRCQSRWKDPHAG